MPETTAIMTDPEFIYLSEASVSGVNPRQQTAYATVLRDWINWMRERGRDQRHFDGLSEKTVENYVKRYHQIMKMIWDEYGFSDKITKKQSDIYLMRLKDDEIVTKSGEAYSESSKRKFSDVLKKFWVYRTDKYGSEPWTPPVEFRDCNPQNPADKFSPEERKAIYNAALEYQSPPAYSNLSPEERSRWQSHIAELLGKSKSKVTPSDFNRLRHDWKIPSIVACTLDGALRPVEIYRSKVDWIQSDKTALQIPGSAAAKSRETWEVALRQRSIDALNRWQKQRDNIEKYDCSESIWLNKAGNPYTSKNLNYLLGNLLEIADISGKNRKLVWYSFRKSTAEFVHSETDDTTTAAVLRSSIENVKNYSGPSLGDRRRALERVNDRP